MHILMFLVLGNLILGNRRSIKRFNRKLESNVKFLLKSIGDFSEWISKQITPIYKDLRSKINKNPLPQEQVNSDKVVNLDEYKKSKEKAV